ncbi:hypothetical protein GF337_02445 [candidate division KSB1 bacterium]|nr:hypothetical protein [candidate division KSB1 bacterium]
MLKKLILLIILGAHVWFNCGTTHIKTDAEYRREIEVLREELIDHPGDKSILQDLGIAYYSLQDYKSALKYLIRSFKVDPTDAKTMAYLGMTLEAKNKNSLALKIYKRHTKASGSSHFRNIMAVRAKLLRRKVIENEIQQLLQNEQQLSVSNIKPGTVAVFPMTYHGYDVEYSALGKGLSEMIITDLSQVQSLTLIDRVRLQALMDEISLGQSGLVDDDSAPRFGKLLGASKIIHGGLDVIQEEYLQLNVAYWDVFDNDLPEFAEQSDQLSNLFKIEKDIVFQILEDMEIEITPAERQRIQYIPTKNIHAFMAYCMGLDQEDAGNFGQAAKYYQQSLQIDPQFKKAASRLSDTQLLSSATFSSSGQLSFDQSGLSSDPLQTSENSLVNSRLNNLNSNIGSFFIPGQESRESAEEADNANVEIFDDLPDPPAPPPPRP